MTIANTLRGLLGPGRDMFSLAQLDVRQRRRNQAIVRGLAQATYIGRSMVLGRVLGRYKMLLDADDRGLSPHLILDGFWEMWVTEAIAQVVKPGMIVADIGANLGYFTVMMAELVGPEGRVHAFEPNPVLAGMIATSCHMNGLDGRVQVHATALAVNDTDLFRLTIPAGYPSGGFLNPLGTEEAAAIAAGGPAGPDVITARRLDSVPDLAAVDVVKIDAEGAERAIWDGMARIFAGGRPLVVFLEFTTCRYPDPAAFLAEIQAHGFDLAIITMAAGVHPTTVEAILAADPRHDQMLMLRRG